MYIYKFILLEIILFINKRQSITNKIYSLFIDKFIIHHTDLTGKRE